MSLPDKARPAWTCRCNLREENHAETEECLRHKKAQALITNNDFLRGFLQCALWSGHDESDESGGEPLDRNYDLSDIAPESVERAALECAEFAAASADDLGHIRRLRSPDGDKWDAYMGHNFWLTRNGHGTGFWDRGWEEVGDRLTAASEAAGERYAYVGDDGLIYIQ